ncbi:MAG: bacteriophage holin [Candidatus Absconditabacterales bacterium]
MNHKNLNPLSAGLAVGIYYGVGLFLIGIMALYFGYCKVFVSFFSTFYLGYHATWIGSLIGFLRGLLDGFVGAFVVVWLYNFINKKISK